MGWVGSTRPTHPTVAEVTTGAARSGRYLVPPATPSNVPSSASGSSLVAAAEADQREGKMDIPATFDAFQLGVGQLHQPRGMLRERRPLGLAQARSVLRVFPGADDVDMRFRHLKISVFKAHDRPRVPPTGTGTTPARSQRYLCKPPSVRQSARVEGARPR